MTKDLIPDDEWGITEDDQDVTAQSAKKQGGHSSLKDYIIVALIALIAVMGINNYIYARNNNGVYNGGGVTTLGNTNTGGGGGCCGGGGSGAVLSNDEITQLGLDYYVTKTGDTAVEAQLQDFGCHQEINIIKDGQVIARLAYRGGQITEV